MKETKKAAKSPMIDVREQLFNDGRTGTEKEISTAVERITKLNGILFDLDLCLLRQSALIPKLPHDPRELYEKYVSEWLERHPVLKKAEVRLSGSGLHVLLWLDKPIEFANEAEQKRWAARVQVIQAILPTDPQQPVLNAMTRVVGSVNRKNGVKVELLREGQKVSEPELLELVDEMAGSPFRTIVGVLYGGEHVSPCPCCGKKDTRLGALDQIGKCYKCGKVTVSTLVRAIMTTDNGAKEVGHAA